MKKIVNYYFNNRQQPLDDIGSHEPLQSSKGFCLQLNEKI